MSLMSTKVTRRSFLAGAAGAALAASAADGHKPMNKLGLDFFTLRSQGWDAFQLLDFAAKNGCQVANFSEPRFLGSFDPAHLKKVREHADKLDLDLEVGFGSICPTSTRFDKKAGTAREQLLEMLSVAKALRSPLVRCYMGSSDERKGDIPFEQHIENTVKSCKSVRSEFVDAGIKIGVENHAGDMQSLELKGLIDAAGKDYVGALLDAGNAAWTLEDPLHALEVLAPYAVTTGVRDSRIWKTDDGAAVMWVPLGAGNVGIQRWFERLRELRPDLTFSLEMINVPGPRLFEYAKPQFWDEYRDVPAWVFAQFVMLAERGGPYIAPQAPVSPKENKEAFDAWNAELQRVDAERDLQYCREVLGLGRKV